MTQRSSYSRRGFTIIELLVAMALIILIMAVLSEAFVAGLKAFRDLKGIGDMQERMRLAASRLRQDLALRHFEADRRLSDIDPYWQDPNIGNGDQVNRNIGGRPQQGFFRIQTLPAPYPAGNPPPTTSMRPEGVDGDGIPSWITDPNAPLPVLHFTSKLVPERVDALRRDQVFTTPLPDPTSILWNNEGPPDFRAPGIVNSPWAEIAWFIAPTGETAGSTGATPLYSLYRRQRLLIAPRRDSFLVTPPTANPPGGAAAPANIGLYYGLSVEVDPTPGNNLLLFSTEGSVAEQPYLGRPCMRSMSTFVVTNPPGYPPLPGNGPYWLSTPAPVGTTNGESASLLGDDLVTTDVISFEIKVLRPGDADFRDLNDSFPDGGNPPFFAQRYFGIYDTAVSNQSFLSLRAIKITIRVWDFQTQQSRQISIIQDL
jgi:prepilin-type N-terminal cleavage/methylation domain-containing protein